ncbi:restriction endonuclease subunit S [Burkholderia gladioli]|uniref:restriction endonuclease subunit S n=1 Tax=Burkholderia gladioli TaxID=28095 RepID=UPI001F602F88|nr:restriction endonuclease subunit S [Burkholderia gladioli]NHH82492.1 Type-1 restriction enzyme EcoKI specificity protein [Burkholderia gladioli]
MTPGYKQTDAGVIPDDWDVKQLGELSSVSAGGTPSRSNANYWGGDIPWITTTEIDFRLITESEQFITSIGLKNSAAKLMPAGALLMALYGQGKTRGKVGVLGFEAATNQACAAIILKEGYSREYAFHYLASRYDEIRKLSNTGNQENLNGALVRSIPVLLPPLSEQSAIATALSDVDALLSSLDALIAKKRDIKQAAMQQLLKGKTRLPGFGGEWEVKRLGDCLLSNPDYGINAPAAAYSDNLPVYIRITDIDDDGRFNPSPIVSVDSPYSGNYILQDGDVVFARTGASVGKSYRYRVQDGPLVFAGFLIRVRPNPKLLMPDFLAGSVTTKGYWNWVRLMSMRSGQPGINGNEYATLPLLLPPIEEQTAIAEVLSDMDAELAALEARRDKTRLLKQGMMQELLTGKTRLV